MRGIFSIAAFLPATLATPWGPPGGWHQGGGPPQKAVYMLFNSNTTENKIISMPIQNDGNVGEAVLTGTGGIGGFPISTLATPAAVFFSQGSVATGGNYLFTVNSGSNTLSMFSINPADPSHPTLVTHISTQGQFPFSVTYSDALKTVCAVNTGGSGSVMCFKVCEDGLLPAGSPRPLYKGFKATDPPTGPVDSVTEIVFDPQSTALWVVVKGNPASKPATPGVFMKYTVTDGEVASEGKEYQISDIFFNFGTTFVSDDSFLVAATTFGGAIVSLTDNKLTQTFKIPVASEEAICWSAYNPILKQGLLLDAGRTTVEVVDVTTGALKTPIIASLPHNNGTQGGLYDTAVVDNISYSIADPGGVVVLDLANSKQVGYTSLLAHGSRINFQGMATWPNGAVPPPSGGWGSGWGSGW